MKKLKLNKTIPIATKTMGLLFYKYLLSITIYHPMKNLNPTVRIDRFPDFFDSKNLDLIFFEAVVKFPDRVESSFPQYTKQEAIQAARKIINQYKPNSDHLPIYQQSSEQSEELWKPRNFVEKSEIINYQILVENEVSRLG